MPKASAYKVYATASAPAPTDGDLATSDTDGGDQNDNQPFPQFDTSGSRLQTKGPVKIRNQIVAINGAAFTRPAEISRGQSAIGLLLLYIALAITAAPLLNGTIDAEEVRDDTGMVTVKNASYAKAYFLPKGFYTTFMAAMNSNLSSLEWFPGPEDTAFLGIPFMDQPAKGACAILDQEDPTAPDCIIMTGHQGRVSAYGLCRNGSSLVSILYATVLVTPADVPAIIASGNWVENSRESVLAGLLQPPTCVGGTTVEVFPNEFDLRGISGPFELAARGRTGQWFDMMNLPTVIRERMHYLVEKGGTGEGIFLPSTKKQSYDDVIASNTLGTTLAIKMEIEAPASTSKHAYFMLYRLVASTVKLPRLQFTLAVAAQALALLMYMLVVALNNGALNTYHLVTQLLRLPTFTLIAVQLIYVSYYQIFSLMFVHTSDSMTTVFVAKAVYLAGVMFILLQQLDVRSAVTLWPKMANNDAYYLWRITWMLTSLGVFLWSMTWNDPAHYMHYVALVIMMLHPLVYGAIQIVQRYEYKHDYEPVDQRLPKNMTTFEDFACGAPLCAYYYYNTLVTRTRQDGSVMHMTCGKAVRDEGFVLLNKCNMLIRSKDLVLVLFFRYLPQHVAGTLNMSVVVAKIEDDQLQSLRRVSYLMLHQVSRRWDGTISYPDIG